MDISIIYICNKSTIRKQKKAVTILNHYVQGSLQNLRETKGTENKTPGMRLQHNLFQ